MKKIRFLTITDMSVLELRKELEGIPDNAIIEYDPPSNDHYHDDDFSGCCSYTPSYASFWISWIIEE